MRGADQQNTGTLPQSAARQSSEEIVATSLAVYATNTPRYDVLDSGCCGMAGAFGFKDDHYDVSMAIGERVLLLVVRAAPQDTLILADGFSCREQIRQATNRRALDLAQVLRMAIRRS